MLTAPEFPAFAPDPAGVDPAAIPHRTLPTGAQIPALGLGTFGSDRYANDEIARAVFDAATLGYRHFDCASVYGNEPEIGAALRAIQTGVPREELWVTSKVWNDAHGRVEESCRRSLADLGLDYLDLYLVHWPFPNFHAKGVDVTARDPHARPYIHAEFLQTWRQMERLAERGLVRHIGTSNMTVPKLTLLLQDARLPPVCNEMELHPHFQQPELFDFVTAHGIVPIGYSPLGSPARPVRDTAPGDTVDLADPVVVSIAARLGLTPAAVCLKWAIGRGQIPIPFSVKRPQYFAALQAAAGGPLSAEDRAALAGIDQNCRLIKGQVFLWKDGQDWRDLWDESGTLTAE